MAEIVKKVKVSKVEADITTMDVSDRDAKIAELAFYKAEQREFEPGHELKDWYEAEKEFLLEEGRGLRTT
jgi:Protein of unknown function (DUF2934)